MGSTSKIIICRATEHHPSRAFEGNVRFIYIFLSWRCPAGHLETRLQQNELYFKLFPLSSSSTLVGDAPICTETRIMYPHNSSLTLLIPRRRIDGKLIEKQSLFARNLPARGVEMENHYFKFETTKGQENARECPQTTEQHALMIVCCSMCVCERQSKHYCSILGGFTIGNYTSGSANVCFQNKSNFSNKHCREFCIVVVLWEKLNICKWYRRKTIAPRGWRKGGTRKQKVLRWKAWVDGTMKLHTSEADRKRTLRNDLEFMEWWEDCSNFVGETFSLSFSSIFFKNRK